MQEKEELLRKLFQGTCSRQELETLFDILNQEEEVIVPEIMATLLRQMDQSPALPAGTAENIRDRVQAAIREEEKQLQPERYRRTFFGKGHREARRHWPAAAAVLLLIAAGWWMLAHGQPEELLVRTFYGEIRTITLPDSSIATLNGNSSLRFSERWQKGAPRIVQLEGEAHFQVNKDLSAHSVFQVITDDLTVEVLGTVFNVNTREETTSVFLEEGKVKINLEHQQDLAHLLQPGEVIRYSAKRKQLSRPQLTAKEPEISWRSGVMQFHGARLERILEDIAAAHQLEFVIESEALADRRFNISLPTENMDLCMSILGKTTSTEIEKIDGRFHIREPKKE